MHDDTKVVHARGTARGQGDPFLPGPVFAGTYQLSGDPDASVFQYGRYHNPTWSNYERAVGELEGGTTVLFASGMAATTAVLATMLDPGDVIVLPSDAYYTTRSLAQTCFARSGVEVRLAPTSGDQQVHVLDGCRLLWIETPTNPGLEVCDVSRLVAAAHEVGALVLVDNTTATLLGQRPIALGADVCLSSDTKAMTGHGDIVLGHVTVRDAQLATRLTSWRTQTGSIPGPMEVWLAHRSLPTLAVRFQRMCTNALAIAEFLAGQQAVRSVRYPGLPTDPAHQIASRQMQRFGSVLNFELAGQQEARAFFSACRIITEATSFGGVHTTAERRGRWGGDAVPPGFIRMSAGVEHCDDLLEDIRGGLAVL